MISASKIKDLISVLSSSFVKSFLGLGINKKAKELLKQKVPTWPLYDVRSENEFRNEVMKYVNELNTIHEDANIPNIATSHLITPGGFKFIKFIAYREYGDSFAVKRFK